MDRESLAEEIRQIADEIIGLISKFNNEQLNTAPFAGSWTAGQVANHIIKATDGIPDTNTKPVDRMPDEQVDVIKSVFLDFTVKFESPGFIVPDSGPFERRAILVELLRIRNQNSGIAITKDLTALCMDFALPNFGYLTRYEWLKFLVFHTQRHIHQLKNIREKVLLLSV